VGFEEDEGVGGILLAQGVGFVRSFEEGGRVRGLESQTVPWGVRTV
jgi:hypothetical protein